MIKITPDRGFIDRWTGSVMKDGIPEESYNPETKIVSDSSGSSSYVWAVSFNPYRFNRLKQPSNGCPLCKALEDIRDNPHRILDDSLDGFVAVPNKFPSSIGDSVILSRETGDKERPMYTTKDLEGFAKDAENMMRFARRIGMRAAHNGVGAGASITGHEHWQLNSRSAFIGQFGLEAAELEEIKGYPGTRLVEGFPFAQMVLNADDPERVAAFLRRLHSEISSKYDGGYVPHCVCHTGDYVAITPFRRVSPGGAGAGDTVGHITVKTREEFDSVTFDSIVKRMSEFLIGHKELELKQFL